MAQTIDPIDSTITFYAEILASGILKSFDKKGNEVTDTDALIQLLYNPNDNQNFKEFIKEWIYYHYAHGWNYVVPICSSFGFEKKLGGSTKTQLFNPDPDLIEWNNASASFFGFFQKASTGVSFNYKPLAFTGIKYENLIPFFDVRQNSSNPHLGVSRLLAVKQNIQNYSLAGQGKENLIKRSGSQLVSLDAKTDDMGLDSSVGTGQFDKEGNPIVTTHKEKLEEQLRTTGIANNSNGIMFSTLPLKVTPLSAGLENIKFDNLAIEDARVILNKFNLPKEFQNLTTETAKFANRQMAMIEVIQNTIDPLGKSFCQKMQQYFNWENTIVLDYSHLPVFSDNESVKITTKQNLVTLYKGLLDSGIITDADFKLILKENEIIK